MTSRITVDLESKTVDVEIRRLSLTAPARLSAIVDNIADTVANSLRMAGYSDADCQKAKAMILGNPEDQ